VLSPRDYNEYEGESGEVSGRQPVVSAGDPSPVPEFAEHAFDDVAPTVGFTIQRIGGSTAGGGRGDCLDLSVAQPVTQVVRVAGLARKQPPGRHPPARVAPSRCRRCFQASGHRRQPRGDVKQLMQSMAQELACEKIRVNAIVPGAIKTPKARARWQCCGGSPRRIGETTRIAKRKHIMSKTFHHVRRRNHDQTGRESLMESAQWATSSNR
jgi:NAD(P)-dependent dehydrogenase (short-subunit alcohol dehydrogenase family)